MNSYNDCEFDSIGDITEVLTECALKEHENRQPTRSGYERNTIKNRYVSIMEPYAKAIYNSGYRRQEWISVDERLPEPWNDYLVVVKLKYAWETEWEYYVDVAAFANDGGYIDDVWTTFNDWNEGQECHVTHWMPLPEAPKMKGGAE